MPAFAPMGHSLQDKLDTPMAAIPRARNLVNRNAIHFRKMATFFNDRHRYEQMHEIINKQHVISLRLCEHVCTTMAKAGLRTTRADGASVYLDAAYKDKQDSQGKQLFDAFRRRKSSLFQFDRFNRTLLTNIAQLRFFEFLYTNGVLKYITENFRLVERSMSIYMENKKKRQTTTTSTNNKRKRKMAAHQCLLTMTFRKRIAV